MNQILLARGCVQAVFLLAVFCSIGVSQGKKKEAGKRYPRDFPKAADLEYPPRLPKGAAKITEKSFDFLSPPKNLNESVKVASAPPIVDFLFYPNQDYPGDNWSNYGDGCVSNGKYYSAICDTYTLRRPEKKESTGTAYVYEFDPQNRKVKTLVNVSKFLDMQGAGFSPGIVHSQIDMGRDGWLYYAVDRGYLRDAGVPKRFRGDMILRTHPESGKTEIVAPSPIPNHIIIKSFLDSERMIYYGGATAKAGAPEEEYQFFAYDLEKRKMLYSGGYGPSQNVSMILAKSTGRVYFVHGRSDGEIWRYDPAENSPPRNIGQSIGMRAVSKETKEGKVYTVSVRQIGITKTNLWEFDTKTEKAKKIGEVAVGSESNVASLDVGPMGRFLYYVPGANGGGYRDGSALVQFDIRNKSKKVIAFFHPYFEKKYGFIPKSTCGMALSESGDKVFITWNVCRGTFLWDCCALSVVHISKSERK